MSLLYECINTVIAVLISISSGMPNHTASIQLCVQKLRILIEDSDQNCKLYISSDEFMFYLNSNWLSFSLSLSLSFFLSPTHIHSKISRTAGHVENSKNSSKERTGT